MPFVAANSFAWDDADWEWIEVKDFAQRTIYRADGLYWAYWWEFG